MKNSNKWSLQPLYYILFRRRHLTTNFFGCDFDVGEKGGKLVAAVVVFAESNVEMIDDVLTADWF